MRKICKSCNKVCETKFLKCDPCRKLDRLAEAVYKKRTDFWLMFIKDPATGVIHCSGYSHNAKADYKNNPYFVGSKKITVNLRELEK